MKQRVHACFILPKGAIKIAKQSTIKWNFECETEVKNKSEWIE